MKLGIVSDVHEANALLERALARFRALGVDRVVFLGDLYENGRAIERTAGLLAEAGAVGVYGNHDHGLAFPADYHRARFSGRVLDYVATLHPRLEVEGCLFAHREPWLDGSDVAQIWHVDDGESLTADLLARSFAVAPRHRALFVGHFHRWFAAGPGGPLPWDGSAPLALPPEGPTLVVIHAVCDGYAATYDTETGLLAPLDLYAGTVRPESRPLPEGVA